MTFEELKPKVTEIKINDAAVDDTTEVNETSDKDQSTVKEQSKVKDLEKQVSQLKDQYLRTAAEFENYKRRTDAEKSGFFAYAGERLLTELLPVVDDFDNGLI